MYKQHEICGDVAVAGCGLTCDVVIIQLRPDVRQCKVLAVDSVRDGTVNGRMFKEIHK